MSSSPPDTPLEPKRERLELRVAKTTKRVIQRAMAVSGLSAGDLAYEGARRILDEHERFELSGADRDAFLEAIRNPAKPTKALVAAMKKYKTRAG